jgi:hypothetical protein
MAVVPPPIRVAAQWRAARRLYPVYAALAVHYNLGTPPYGADLLEAASHSEPEIISGVDAWLAEMDERIQAHQLRHVLQSSDLARTEQKLHALAERYLSKPKKTDADRDKLDFLLAHYFAGCAPPSFHDRDPQLQDVAEVLEPLLGECSYSLPAWLEPLEDLARELKTMRSLAELSERKIIARGRQMKAASGDLYFASNSLIAFTRFNYLVNRTQNRLLLHDLEAAEKALRQLQEHGVTTADCRAAQLDADQSLESVKAILESTRTRRPGEYGLDDSLTRVVQLRAALEAAVTRRGPSLVSGGDARIQQMERKVEQLQQQVERLRAQLESALSGTRPLLSAEDSREPAAAPVGQELGMVVEIGEANEPGQPVPTLDGDTASDAQSPGPVSEPPRESYASIEQTVEKISTELNQVQAGKRRSGAATIRVTGTVLPLSEPEMNAFLDPITDEDGLLRRSVAARILVVDAIERSKLGSGNGVLRHALDAGEQEMQRVAKAAQEHRNAQRLETANALTAAHRQLTLVLQRARAAARQ